MQPSPFLQLLNPIRNYDWGSRESIASIQNREPSEQPEAELWIGDHPSAPSLGHAGTTSTASPTQSAQSASRRLGEILAEDPVWWLGPDGPTAGLPFLLKILAAAQPLSLQVHPTRERAAIQFAADPGNPYVDANHKPEILCALTHFDALQGFRSLEQIEELLAIVTAHDPSGSVSALLELIQTRADPKASVRRLLAGLLELDQPRVSHVVDALHAALSDLPEAVQAAARRLLRQYPDDVLTTAPLLLNVVRLEPGHALFTDAGTLHSYLSGTGVELMSTSDNVLRAGLTSKSVHVEELLEITDCSHHTPRVLAAEPVAGSGFRRYPTATDEFELAVLDAPRRSTWRETTCVGADHAPAQNSVQVMLCTEGAFDFAHRPAAVQTVNQSTLLSSGEALLIAAGAQSYRVEGQGKLFRASIPSS